jgi:hypothetical protein
MMIEMHRREQCKNQGEEFWTQVPYKASSHEELVVPREKTLEIGCAYLANRTYSIYGLLPLLIYT